MNFILDIGNTLIKGAVYENNTLVKSFVIKELSGVLLDNIYKESAFNKAILSSVQDVPKYLHRWFKERSIHYILLDHETPLPLKNLYKTPETLGYDRIAAAVGAWSLFPGSNILVIDAGTAITYEYVDEHGQYLGGNISPGIATRFKALHTFTKKLPLVEKTNHFQNIGKDTVSAIQAGVIKGVIAEIDAYLNDFMLHYEKNKIFLTGGDADFLVNKLKNTIFVNQYLTLSGLNSILEFNANL